ncbi:tryptophan-rich sensory protein [Paroceanicella profunda]|uniref:Tryptophan-rich sensory protein n=1 Tax=Paroceanicella profunda TaxID=2579971 RepID=A0A5B8FGU5_9RHOB|nr:TspO/MBR family protein [Paroceanicella profunda]QDL91407.1 tryptophan-rich sensory protein [Paroceanicella profunda]
MDLTTLAALVVAAGAAAGTGVLFQPGEWYRGLVKPAWTPPNRAFPIAWTVLYVLMVWAGYRIAQRPDAGPALALWAAQIALNAVWSPTFFGLHRPGIAFLQIALLWIAVAAMIAAFWARDIWSALLMAPYLVWISYAGALNLVIWDRNPSIAFGQRRP